MRLHRQCHLLLALAAGIVLLSARFSCFEAGHHLVCEAPVIWLQDDVFWLCPEGAAELFAVHLDGVVAVEVAVESGEDVGGAAPRLGFVVADVLDLEADFFGDFTLDRLFEGLADLGESCYERVDGRVAVACCVARQKDLSIVQDTDDDGRVDARIDDMVALGAAQGALFCVEDDRLAADAAEAVRVVPAVEVQGCVEGVEARQLCLLVLTDVLDGLEGKICRDDWSFFAEQQEECLLADREEVDAAVGAAELGKRREELAFILAHEYRARVEDEYDAVIHRLSRRLVLVVEFLWCNILDHGDSFL